MSMNIESKRGMLKSHAERMCEAPVVYLKSLASDYEVRGIEEVVENGRILKKTVYRNVHPQDYFKGMNALDFALENVIAVGALESLKESYLGANTTSELADSMEGTIDNVISAVDSVESNVQPNNDGGNE